MNVFDPLLRRMLGWRGGIHITVTPEKLNLDGRKIAEAVFPDIGPRPPAFYSRFTPRLEALLSQALREALRDGGNMVDVKHVVKALDVPEDKRGKA